MSHEADREETLLALLGWGTALSPLEPLINALSAPSSVELSPDAAICLDANTYLRLRTGRTATELIDYLAERHLGPLIVSTQTLQELWNNHVGAIPAVADQLKTQLTKVNETIHGIDPEYESLKSGAHELVRQFSAEYGHVLDEGARHELVMLLTRLDEKAIVSQVNRARFADTAALRKRSKTPPGFKDDGDGDFFVWAELLNGLLMANARGHVYDRVVLVTNDVKKDWSTNGQPHPMLVAEVSALVHVPFQVMTLEALKAKVHASLEQVSVDASDEPGPE